MLGIVEPTPGPARPRQRRAKFIWRKFIDSSTGRSNRMGLYAGISPGLYRKSKPVSVKLSKNRPLSPASVSIAGALTSAFSTTMATSLKTPITTATAEQTGCLMPRFELMPQTRNLRAHRHPVYAVEHRLSASFDAIIRLTGSGKSKTTDFHGRPRLIFSFRQTLRRIHPREHKSAYGYALRHLVAGDFSEIEPAD